jgi:transducin (beta)-like 1
LFSWFAGIEKPGVFEIDWQEHDGINRIALALECREVAVLDVTKIDVFKKLLQTTKSTVRIEDVKLFE